MLRDPTGGRISADERVEETTDARVYVSTHIVGIQKESLFMIILIGHDGVQWV